MKLPRRSFLHLAAGAVALPALWRTARAQSYPIRPVRFVVGFPASNASDIVARLMAQSLSDRLGQQFVVENRPGAGSNIGTEMVVRAAPDGYTLLLVVPSSVINATLYPNLNYNFIRDVAPVGSIGDSSFVMVVNPSVPAKTVPEFIAYAKANPGKINMASAGNGTATHVFGELFKMMTSVDMVHVPGKLRALAVTTASRSPALPDIPTIGEFVSGYDASALYGVGAPKNTPTEIIDRLNKEINLVLSGPEIKDRLADLGFIPMPMTPAEFGKRIADQTEKWGKVVRAANIKPD